MNVQSTWYCFGSESSFLTGVWAPGTGEEENSQDPALHVLVQEGHFAMDVTSAPWCQLLFLRDMG